MTLCKTPRVKGIKQLIGKNGADSGSRNMKFLNRSRPVPNGFGFKKIAALLQIVSASVVNERMKKMKTKLLVLVLIVPAMCALATAAVAAPPTITVGESVGANPSTVYTAGQTTRVVNVVWNAGSDYAYCEIY